MSSEIPIEMSAPPTDLSHVPSSIIEHHMARAFEGETTFSIGEMVIDRDTLSQEYQRRIQASEFNR